MTDAKETAKEPSILTAHYLLTSDKELKDVDAKKYQALASSTSVDTAVKALIAKGHLATSVKDSKEALALLKELVLKDKKKSISMGASTTLDELGFIDWLKTDDVKDIKNFKGEAAALDAQGKSAEAAAARAAGSIADIFFTGVAAVSEEGDIVTGDATSSRSPGLLTAGHCVVILGAQKVVKTYEAAVDRLYHFQLPLESARARIAYRAWGIKGSSVNSMIAIRNGNPFNPKRIHVIIVNEALGY